jgi:VCBS repeat-containing protein
MTFATKGFAQPFAAIGREIFIKNFDLGAAMSQANLQALVEAVQLTSSIVAIGAFTAGTSESVSMIIDGKDVTAVAGYTVTDVAF